MNTHRHRPVPRLTWTTCYRGSVSWPGNPAAHGNITEHEVCACGATRAVNVNGLHVERGPWKLPRHGETMHYQAGG